MAFARTPWVLAIFCLAALAPSAHAQSEAARNAQSVAPPPPLEQPSLLAPSAPSPARQAQARRRRVLRSAGVVAAGVTYLLSETVLKDALTADECRWCRPPGIDESVRDAIVWSDREQADSLSNLTGYVAAPIVGVGLTALIGAARDGEDPTFARVLDDTLPVLESVAYSQLVVQAVKFSVGRQRPRVRFATEPMEPGNDDNVSFFSGHSALTFALATSAGLVAERRDSRLAPAIWTLGLGLAGATAFLRIAADEHYFSDVMFGSAFGAAAGYLAVRFSDEKRAHGIVVLPAPGGLSLIGTL